MSDQVFPKTFNEFVQSSKSRVGYRNHVQVLHLILLKMPMDILHMIASYLYTDCSPEPYNEVVIEVFKGLIFDSEKPANDKPVYRFELSELLDFQVPKRLSELIDLKKVIWRFICSQEFSDIKQDDPFFDFWNFIQNDSKKHVVMCSDFALHALPLDLQKKVLSDQRKAGSINVYLCSNAKRLGQMHGSVELLKKAKLEDDEKDNDFKITIVRMPSTRTFKNVKPDENLSIILAKSDDHEPIYIQVRWNGILFNLLSAHFCELKKISGRISDAISILQSVGVDKKVIDEIPESEIFRVASVALQRQSSCSSGPNLELVRSLTEIPKADNCCLMASDIPLQSLDDQKEDEEFFDILDVPDVPKIKRA